MQGRRCFTKGDLGPQAQIATRSETNQGIRHDVIADAVLSVCLSVCLPVYLPVFGHISKNNLGAWASYQIHTNASCACAGKVENVFPATDFSGNCYRFRHASRHVRDARAEMLVGIANPRWRGNVPGTPGACTTSNLTYLAKGLWTR